MNILELGGDTEPWAWIYLAPAICIYVVSAYLLMFLTAPVWLTIAVISNMGDYRLKRIIRLLEKENEELQKKLEEE